MTDRETVNLRVPTQMLVAAQKYADAKGISRNAALTLALDKGLAALTKETHR